MLCVGSEFVQKYNMYFKVDELGSKIIFIAT